MPRRFHHQRNQPQVVELAVPVREIIMQDIFPLTSEPLIARRTSGFVISANGQALRAKTTEDIYEAALDANHRDLRLSARVYPAV